MVRIAVYYFLDKGDRELTDEEKAKVERCLEFIKFGMGHTFLQFEDKYYDSNAPESLLKDVLLPSRSEWYICDDRYHDVLYHIETKK